MSRIDSPTWRCPVCAREFAKKSQAHSCKVASIVTHLRKGSPDTLRIYAALERALRQCGPYRVVPTKTQINLMARTTFAGMTIRRGWINLGLVLTRDLDDPRVLVTEQISPRTFAHRVQLRSEGDIDKQLRQWLKEAYQVGMSAGRR